MDKTGISPGLCALLIGSLDLDREDSVEKNPINLDEEGRNEPRQGSTPQERAQEALL